jgi:hypothetical protein
MRVAAATVLPTPFTLDAWSRTMAADIYNSTIEGALLCVAR